MPGLIDELIQGARDFGGGVKQGGGAIFDGVTGSAFGQGVNEFAGGVGLGLNAIFRLDEEDRSIGGDIRREISERERQQEMLRTLGQ